MNKQNTATHAQILKIVQEIIDDKYGCNKDFGTAIRICEALKIDTSKLDWSRA